MIVYLNQFCVRCRSGSKPELFLHSSVQWMILITFNIHSICFINNYSTLSPSSSGYRETLQLQWHIQDFPKWGSDFSFLCFYYTSALCLNTNDENAKKGTTGVVDPIIHRTETQLTTKTIKWMCTLYISDKRCERKNVCKFYWLIKQVLWMLIKFVILVSFFPCQCQCSSVHINSL